MDSVKEQFEDLLQAIVDDKPGGVRKLLAKQPSLARQLVAKPRLYRGKILHCLYAKDTALHLAAAGYRVEIGKELLAAGADPNAAHNHRLGRPLHYASDGNPGNETFDANRQEAMIRMLLKAGAEIDAADKNGATALHRAVRTRCAEAVACLLEKGADPQARNHSGATPLHLAVQNTGRGGSGTSAAREGQRHIIAVLLKCGMTPEIRDGRGKSVLDWAKNGEIRKVLMGGTAFRS